MIYHMARVIIIMSMGTIMYVMSGHSHVWVQCVDTNMSGHTHNLCEGKNVCGHNYVCGHKRVTGTNMPTA